MTKPSSAPALAVGAMLALLHATPASALSKVWVANTGTDSVACGAAASPCRTFARALGNAAGGGEIGVLTPGDYGPIEIRKSISIMNDGAGNAGLLNTDGTCPAGPMGILASPGDVISLRGLVFEGCVAGVAGIIFETGSALHIQNVVIKNYESGAFANTAGLSFQPSVNAQLFVSDSFIFNNGSLAGTGGILIQPIGNGSARVVLDRVHLENNVVGLRLDAATSATGGSGIRVTMRDSVVAGNASDGVSAFTQAGKPFSLVFIDRTTMVNNAGNGILADGPHATVLLRDSVMTQNGAGISTVNGGQLISYGNNANNTNIGPEGAPTGFFSPM